MGKLSKMAPPKAVKGAHVQVTSAVKTKAKPRITHQGGVGYNRKAKGELFLFATANMVGQDTFYEGSSERDARFRELVWQVTAKDPDWVARFIPYLRDEMQMRSASVVMAVETILARIDARSRGLELESSYSFRQVIDSALQRPDEPGEFIGYWQSRTGRRTLPGGVQRGLGDAVMRMFTERVALKYDGVGNNIRLGDVLELVHPPNRGEWQRELYTYLLDRRHNPKEVRADLAKLPMISSHIALDEIPVQSRATWIAQPGASETIKAAGYNWEELSYWLQGPLTASMWEAMIPSMGYMALLRNLRNFEQAGISKDVVRAINLRLSDPDEVAKSRQFPMRFLSAVKAVANSQWVAALDDALDLSTRNVPALEGRTLILVDLSGSMYGGFGRSELQLWEAAAVFGSALALRAKDATLVAYGSQSRVVDVPKGGSVMPLVRKFSEHMGGTNTASAFQRHFAGHDRVVCLTDEQASWGQSLESVVPKDVWLHTFNLAGYAPAQAMSGNDKRATFGGLTDKGFKVIPQLEAGLSESWPF